MTLVFTAIPGRNMEGPRVMGMKLLGAKTPKRSIIWGNTPRIWRFKTGHLKVSRKKAQSLLVKKYKDATGKARFVGKKKPLKHSAFLECKHHFFNGKTL